MNIIIVGGGKVGSSVTDLLVREGHSITVIDTSQRVIDDMVTSYDVMGICGNGALYNTQVEAGAEGAELLIATTSMDELNILCCLVARKIGVGHTVARVRNPEYSAQSTMITNDFGISMTVNPEYDTAVEISRNLRFASVDTVDSFFRGRVELVGIKVRDDSELIGMSLMEINRKYRINVLICAVARGDETFIPRGSFVLQAGDHIRICGRRNDLSAFMKRLGEYKERVRHVMIAGGGRMGYYLARELDEEGMTVKIIDKSEARCNELVAALPGKNITVINGDVSTQKSLTEQGISSQDAFVSLTGIDEVNIISSMFAKASGVDKIITKVNRLPGDLLARFGVENCISPRETTATRIMTYVRSLSKSDSSGINTLSRLLGGSVEAIEFTAHENDKCVGVPLKKLPLLSDLLIAALMRKNKILYPSGDDRIEEGDRVLVVTREGKLSHLDDILR